MADTTLATSETSTLSLLLSDVQRQHIAACYAAGTLHVPKSGGGVTVKPDFKNFALEAKLLDVKLIEVGAVNVTGRTDKSGLATADSVYKVVCKIQAGQLETDIRLHLCDVVGLLKGGGTGQMSFSAYKADNGNEYLVPTCVNRASSAEIFEYINQ